MIYIIYILLTIYVLVYFVSRPEAPTVTTKKRILLYACALSLLILGQSFNGVTKPPQVNYYQTGWMGFIQFLNARFAERGIVNRIPAPSGQ